ncbi:MAG: ribose-5-phosphate isomerase RpiA [Paracoccaceae bacterium]|jgi:ribose 5-phosphate isomerase A|nr:ribose-5-phosphate isomerase RpiA [Paracoccaceae bacterium]|tara:strand:+ start:2277 stop:3005 length:729 start_codon:yes stop_codon:yes gene_type:complete
MIDHLSLSDRSKYACALRASALVENGMKVGLGTGSTAYWLVYHLAERVRSEGLEFVGVPTSNKTREQAQAEGLKLISMDDAGRLDITIDGADEFDQSMNLIKGGGGAHLQEKIVAFGSDRMVVIADETKKVNKLGKFPLPVEVLKFGSASSQKQIEELLIAQNYRDFTVQMRMEKNKPFITDEGNYIFDLNLGEIQNPRKLCVDLNIIPGVVENGLFIDVCKAVVIGYSDGTAKISWKDNVV